MCRIFHCVEVIEVAEEFVEAVDSGQELIQIAEMVLPELAGGVALRFERGSDGASLCGNPDFGTSLADRGHACANRKFTHDEVRQPGRATGLGVIVSEQHSLLGHLVEVRRSPSHHSALIFADVPLADVYYLYEQSR